MYKKIVANKGFFKAASPCDVKVTLSIIDEKYSNINFQIKSTRYGESATGDIWENEYVSLCNIMSTFFVRAASQYGTTTVNVLSNKADNVAAEVDNVLALNTLGSTTNNDSYRAVENNPTAASASIQNPNMSNKKKIVCIAVGIVVFILITAFLIPLFSEASVKTYVYEQGAFRGEFKIDFDNGSYEYSGNDIDMLANDGMFVPSITITKSGKLLDFNETINGNGKYSPINMDYNMFVNSDKTTISYGGYTFKINT